MQVGMMCGRSGNYDRSAEQQCQRGYNVKSYAAQNHYVTKYSKTGAGKYRFSPNGSGRSDLPTLQFSKIKVADTVGPSYKFDFNQHYMGFIFWARLVRFWPYLKCLLKSVLDQWKVGTKRWVE